jgi:acetyl esterase/lipase
MARPTNNKKPRRGQAAELVASLWKISRPTPSELHAPQAVDIPMALASGTQLHADIYLPEEPLENRPSIVLVHGGGFVLGSRKMRPVRLLADALVRRGFAVAAINYRLLFRGGNLSASSQDVREAFSWWAKQATEYSLDPDRISAMGLSAGAALTLLALGDDEGHPINRVVCGYGLYDLSTLEGFVSKILRRKLTGTGNQKQWRTQSPIEKGLPKRPLLMLHGTADGLSPVDQAHAMNEARIPLEEETKLVIYEGAHHSFFSTNDSPFFRSGLEEVIHFLQP